MTWPNVRLSSIFEIARGGSPRPISEFITDDPDGLNWISITDASNSAKYITKTKLKIRQEGLVKSRLVRPGDFLLTNSMSFGRPYIMKTTGCIHDGWLVLSGDKQKVNQDYFYYLLGSEVLHQKFSELAAGAVVKNLNIDLVKGVEIPLPPLAEQKKIAAILDAADQLRQKDQQLIDHYTALSQSLFLDMFGDPVSNPMGWEKDKMGRHFRIQRGGSPRPINDYLGGTYPWIKIGDGTKGEEIYLRNTKEHIIEDGLKKTRLLPAGSIIFANCGVSLGLARIITFEGCIHDGWLSFSNIDESVINKIFLLKTLNSITNYFRATAPDGTQPNLNTSIMKKFELILPPIELQDMFVERLQAIENAKAQAKQTCELSISLFESLLQRAFKGELTSSKAA